VAIGGDFDAGICQRHARHGDGELGRTVGAPGGLFVKPLGGVEIFDLASNVVGHIARFKMSDLACP
jgi:hypothetical protein